MTFWILLAIAGFLTLLALRYHIFWLSSCGMLAWFAVWWYNIDNPPSNISVNSFGHQILYFLFLLLAIGTFFNWVRNRNRISPGYQRTAREQADYQREFIEASKPQESGEEEYRQRVRRALHQRRRR